MKKTVAVILCIAFAVSGLLMSADASRSFILGDANLNGKVTAEDARIVLRTAAALDMIDDQDAWECADVDRDGRITATDARLVLRTAAQLIVPVTLTVPDEQVYTGVSPYTTSVPDTGPVITTSPDTGETPSRVSFTVVYDYNMKRPAYPAEPSYEPQPDTFYITTYGYGHGVGLSQDGAIGMALRGCSYTEILSHYYTGVNFAYDSVPPVIELVWLDESVSTYEFMCRVVEREIGGDSPYEALKAQAVTAFTMAKYYNYRIPNRYQMAYVNNFSSCTEDVKRAVSETLGMYLEYDGKPVDAVFGACSCGRTANPSDVWGGYYPYLAPVDSFDDILVDQFSTYDHLIVTKSFSSDKMRAYIRDYNSGIALDRDPSKWIKVLAHDRAVDNSLGYVTQMRIGDKTLTSCAGQIFRVSVMNYSIRSHCFRIVYYDSNLKAYDLGMTY